MNPYLASVFDSESTQILFLIILFIEYLYFYMQLRDLDNHDS